MSAAVPSHPAAAPGWRMALTMARRELRTGLKGFRVFLACLTLGVAAIAAVGSVSAALVSGLDAQGRSILGGDVDLRLVHRRATAPERAFLEASGAVSEIATLRTMARAAHASAAPDPVLVELKAVDPAWPLAGDLILEPPLTRAQTAAALAPDSRGIFGAALDPELADRLNLAPGGMVRIGDLDVQVRAIIVREPDNLSGGFGFGPRVLVARKALDAAGLIRPGSLMTWRYRVALPPSARTPAAVGAWTQRARRDFPEAGWRITDRSGSAPGVRRAVAQVAVFLSLIGLTALTAGGVGVGNAVRGHLLSRHDVIAIFKCLGAPGPLVFRIYLLQIMMLAGTGILAGLVLGAAAPAAMGVLLPDLLPGVAQNALYWPPLLLAAAYGILVALVFTIWPLARVRDIPVSGLFRDIVAPARAWPRPAYFAATGAALAALCVLVVAVSATPRLSAGFLAGLAGAFVLLRLLALAVAAAAAWVRPTHASLRLALANIHRPGAPTASAILSLGLGLSLLSAVAMIGGNLNREIRRGLPDRAPAFFFLDVQPAEADGFAAFLRDQDGMGRIGRAPMLRGRIIAVNGTAAEDLNPHPDVAWALRGDRGLTYAATLPENSTLVSGAWWPPDYGGPPLVSLPHDLAQGFGMAPGDTITVNVLGRNLTATVANTRSLNWRGMGINFVFVFAPGTMEAVPHTRLITATMDPDRETDVQRAVVMRFPHVAVLRVRDVLERVNGLLANLALAVNAAGGLTVLMGALVLAGALAAGYQSRRRDTVILKVLGATRGRILRIHAMEYALLGLVTAAAAALAGTAAAWVVVTQVLEMEWVFLPQTLALTALAAAALALGAGLAGTFRALRHKPAAILRTD